LESTARAGTVDRLRRRHRVIRDGPSAVYSVVPLLAGLTVWLTYALARRTTDARTALIAAVLSWRSARSSRRMTPAST